MMKITYIGHSGFSVEMDDAVFLFDYYKGELPELDTAKKLFVFASHAHYDHFQKAIFQFREQFAQVFYILSEDIRTSERLQVWFVGADQELTVEGCRIRTLRSTDEGVAFLLSYQGKTLYHAGDLNGWYWDEEGEAYVAAMRRDYQREIDKLTGERIDAAFVPVDPRLEKQYCQGLDYFMRRTDTKKVFPMHFWGDYRIFEWLGREKCTEPYADRIVKLGREGEQFDM